MDAIIRARLEWVKLYLATQDAGYVCRHCGISRPTLRKWLKRYQAQGIPGLSALSKRPINSPNKKLDTQLTAKILELRNERNIGARRIQLELFREHNTHLSLASIHKALKRANAKPIKKLKRNKQLRGYTSLHCVQQIASYNKDKYIQIISFLLAHGADVTLKNADGETPLDIEKRIGRFSWLQEALLT